MPNHGNEGNVGDTPTEDLRERGQRLSKGHNPPRYVDKELPTFEDDITAIGGPGKDGPESGQGSHPWVLGSKTIGTGEIWQIDLVEFDANSAPAWFVLRHNRSGSHQGQGGTLEAWLMQNAGDRVIVGDESEAPVASIREPGTVELLGFGARSRATGANPYGTIGTRPTDNFKGRLRGNMY